MYSGREYKNILVTGGCGFIGSNMILYILDKYPDAMIYNLDKLDYCASTKNVDIDTKHHNNYIMIRGNICDLELVKMILIQNQIDLIIHFAAQSHVDNSFNNSLQYTVDNVHGTHTLLEASRLYGKLGLFLHMSTDEVYGESIIGSDVMNTEKSLLKPTNPYAASKAAAECILHAYGISYNFPQIIVRGNNVYGPRQYPEKLIPKFITLLQDNKKCTIHGSGKTVRAFIHVLDLCRAIDLIICQGQIGEIYNIGSSDEFSVMEIAQMLIHELKFKESDKTNQINTENLLSDTCKWIGYVKDRDFNDQRYYINCDKLKSLGYRQEITFAEGLKNTIMWYKKLDMNNHWNNH